MNTEQLLKVIKDGGTNEDRFREFVETVYTIGQKLTIDDLNIEIVEKHGGGEGEGSCIAVVFKVNDNDYFRTYGSYDSWDGSNWDNLFDITQVNPTQKMVTVYEDVK